MPDARTFLTQALAEVHATVEAVDTASMDVAAATIASASACFVAGQGRSGLVGRMFAMRLAQLGRAVHAVGDATAPAIEGADLLVACSGSGETSTTCLQAERAREHRATVLAVTSQPASRLASLAEHLVVIPTAPSSQLGAARYEQALLIVLDAIASRVADGLGVLPAEIWRRHANLE